ncbi:MAG: hypothetical protein GXP31_07170 [Kiritimatiellaeota bacterium]|nr:hypothetical protein [Kiritimatiellota bacterium]
MPDEPRKAPPEPGLGWFALGMALGAGGVPMFLPWVSRDASGPPGIPDGAASYGAYVLILLLAGGVAFACFAMGRAVRRQRRRPRQRFIPPVTYAVIGALIPTVFLLVTRFTDWGERIVGLHWALTIGGPFLLGLYTAPNPSATRQENSGSNADVDAPRPGAGKPGE